MFKSFSAFALLVATVVSVQAQSGPSEASRAPLDAERGRLSAAATDRTDVAVRAASCGGVGQAACAKAADGQSAERVAAPGEPDALALAWAALGVVAFVALRRRPR